MRLHKGITHLLGEGLEFVKSAPLVTGFKCGKDGFVIRLSSRDEVIEDACKFVSGVLDGLKCTVASAVRAVIIA